jgi:hypothetical protein
MAGRNWELAKKRQRMNRQSEPQGDFGAYTPRVALNHSRPYQPSNDLKRQPDLARAPQRAGKRE